MTLRRDFLPMTAGAVAAGTVLPMAAKAGPVLRGVDPGQSPRLARYSTATAALADIQAGLPPCLFHELLEGGLRMAARVSPGGGTFRDITMKLAMAEHVLAVQEATGPHPDAALLAACYEFVTLELRLRATLNREDSADQLAAGAAVRDAICALQNPLQDVIEQTPARTLDGIKAKARALVAWDEDAISGDAFCTHDIIRGSLLRDLVDADDPAMWAARAARAAV